jgi:hypothetical protein
MPERGSSGLGGPLIVLVVVLVVDLELNGGFQRKTLVRDISRNQIARPILIKSTQYGLATLYRV